MQYCMTIDDEASLNAMNRKRSWSSKCSVDHFEEVIDFFEQISKSRQPFATVDNAPVIGFEELSQSPEFYEAVQESARAFAEEIYAHWKEKRIKHGNKPLMPHLRVCSQLLSSPHESRDTRLTSNQGETGQETDDGDPYVCFRRREMRHTRKTRGRDAQSIEKLKKLRRELEDARRLVAMVKQRELTKGESLALEKTLFDQRTRVKETKRKLGIKTDDDDLINQKPQKPQKTKVVEPTPATRPPGPQLRLSMRSEGRAAETDLVGLQDVLREKENDIYRDIEEKLAGHRAWLNKNPDLTRLPLLPAVKHHAPPGFRAAVAEYLPSPPPSVSSDSPRATSPNELRDSNFAGEESITVRYQSPPCAKHAEMRPSYRRRIGRGGRLMIDRRGLQPQSKEGIDPVVLDRFKFDQEDDDDDPPVFEVDRFDQWSLQYRAALQGNRDIHIARPMQAHSARPQGL